jgi:hypothetical protein
MRIKTPYRKYKDGGRVLPDGTMAGTPTPLDIEIDSPRAHIAADTATAHLQRAVEAGEPAASIDIDNSSDDASEAFKKQIDALRQSEEIQRQRAAQAALTKNEIQFLKDNPDFIKRPDIAQKAIIQAHQQGHVPDSAEFHRAVKQNWEALRGESREFISNRYLEEMEKLGESVSPVDRVVDEARSPRFANDTADVPARDQYEPFERTRNVSAPVSRETMANGGYDRYGDRPGRVTLSVAQKEHARIAGISEREYAEQLIRLREEQKNGNYHGGQP